MTIDLNKFEREFKYIVKKCDMIINSDYEADDFV